MKLRKRSKNNQFQINSDISIIPFLDILLVLLVIFMIFSSSAKYSEIKINVPMRPSSAQQSLLDEKVPKSIEIQINSDEIIQVNNKVTSKNKLRQYINKNHKQVNTIYLYADQSLAYGKVIDLFSLLEKIPHIEKVLLISQITV